MVHQGRYAKLLRSVKQRHFRQLFQLMLATGLQISEAIALQVSDLDRDWPLIRIRCGKGGEIVSHQVV